MPTDLRTLLRASLSRAGVPAGSSAATASLPSAQAQVKLAAQLSGQSVGLSEIEQIALHAEPQLTDLIFNEANNVSVPAGTTTVIVTYKPPANTLGILRWFATGIQNLSDFDVLTWQLVVGGNPVYGFDNIKGPIASILDPMPMFWPIFQGQAVVVQAQNPASSGITVAKATGLVRGSIFTVS